MQKRVYTVNKKGKEVMIVDYSGCREEEMIQIVLVLKDRLIAENKHRLLLSIYGEGTPDNHQVYG